MKDKEIKLSDISILSAHDVDASLLFDFYNIMEPERSSLLPHIWKWLCRSSFYDNKTPLVILYNDCIIAHAGMMPFNVFFDGKYYTASWFIDFAVLPEFQRQGLGTLLAERWMEFSDLCVEAGHNEKSGGAFKKLNWVESFDSYLHYYFIKPSSQLEFINSMPLFLRKILNNVPPSFFKIINHQYISSIDNLRFDDLNSDSLDKFINSIKMTDNTVEPIRDYEYISWRLLNSPDKNKYRIISIDEVNNISIVIKLENDVREMGNNPHSKHIDLLLISDSSKYSVIRHMISTLATWCFSKGYYYIRYYTSSKGLSDYLSKSLNPRVGNPNFMYYTQDIALLKKLKHSNWHFELIDNDYEFYCPDP